MWTDATLVFSPFAPAGTPQTLVVTTSTASTNTIDITGAGVGNTPSVTYGDATVFGADMGIGDGAAAPSVVAIITTALTTTNSATLNIQFQSAPDNGSDEPGTWTTGYETGAIAASGLTAATRFRFAVPSVAPGGAPPRFYRLNYVLPASTSFTAGAISAGIVIGNDYSDKMGNFPSSYVAV